MLTLTWSWLLTSFCLLSPSACCPPLLAVPLCLLYPSACCPPVLAVPLCLLYPCACCPPLLAVPLCLLSPCACCPPPRAGIGHPITSGVRAIDYAVVSEYMIYGPETLTTAPVVNASYCLSMAAHCINDSSAFSSGLTG